MESKITTSFEAKTEQKISYLPDFGGLPRAVGNFSVITKLRFIV